MFGTIHYRQCQSSSSSPQNRRGVSGCEGASRLHSGRLWVGQLPHLHPVLIQVSTMQYCAPASTSVSVLLFTCLYFSLLFCISVYLSVLVCTVPLCTSLYSMQRADAVLLQLWYRARHRHLSGQFRYLHKYLLFTVSLDIYTNIYYLQSV